MNIGVDLDDVLVDFMSAFVRVCNDLYGRPELGLLPVDWEWSNLGLSQKEISDAWSVVKNTDSFWETLGVEPGVDPYRVKELSQQHDLFFITARVPTIGATVKNQSCYWLRKNMMIDYPTVIVSYDKGPIAKALKLDYFIDDRPKNVLEIKAVLPDCKVFLKDSSHNQTFNDPDIFRVKDMNEFMDILELVRVGFTV